MAYRGLSHVFSVAKAMGGFILIGVMLCNPAAVRAIPGAAKPGHMAVVDEKAFPAFAYLEQTGTARGLTIEALKRWGRKTGIPAEFRPMDREAQRNAANAILFEGTGRFAATRSPWGELSLILIAAVLFTGTALLWNLVLRRRISAALRDLTEKNRQLAEVHEALLISEKKFRTIFDNAPIGIFRSSFDGRIIEANAAMARMIGYKDREEFLRTVEDLGNDIYPRPEERRRLLDALVQSPQRVRMPIELRRKDGSPLYSVISASLQMDESGRPAYLDGTIENVTPLKHAELELRLLAAAVEQSGELIVITNAGGVIQYVNRAFEKITGYSRQEAIGQRPNLLKSGEHDRAFYEDLWQTISHGKDWTGRFRNVGRDGVRFVEEATISPVFDEKGTLVNYVAAKRDITRQLALEEQYRQMQKMEALGQLTGGVAHDFNNLLQAINGYTELAMMESAPDGRVRNFLGKARGVGRRATNLVQQLLLFSRRKAMEPKVLDLNTVVNELLKMLDRLIGEHIRIEWRPQADPCIVHGDSGMLDQVLMNLCVNARDAMPDGGVLTIETRSVRLEKDFCAHRAWARPGRFAALGVADTGCGMDRETQEHIFEPFFTTKGEGKGTGLGLATIYGIVQQHHGMIDVSSEPGKGTVFKVYLPLYEQEEAEARAEIDEAPAGGVETILLAEDDGEVRELACTILQRAGYTVLSATDGEDAVRLFKQHRDRIAMLILDVVMPRMGGRTAFDRIRELRPGIGALFLSGYDGNAPDTHFASKEGLALIQKPYSPKLLLRTVREVLDASARRA